MDRTLALDVTHYLINSVFRWDRDHHVNMIGHQMSLLGTTLLLRGQLPENLTEVTPHISIQSFPGTFRNKHNVIFAVSLLVT